MLSYNYSGIYRDLVVGVDTEVPVISGGLAKVINFDNAATTPPFVSVMEEIIRFVPWYSSIHRGTGYKSKLCSDIYDNAREEVLRFVKGDLKKDTVIFVKNTTEAINKLSYRLCNNCKCMEKYIVLSTMMEHHSNDLPWRDKFMVDYIDVDGAGRLSVDDLEEKLLYYDGLVKLVAVTGASNVTGFTNPIYKIAKLAHKYGAKILVDGAQAVPHLPIDMKSYHSLEHIDYLAFSAHKMYAPFGIGVLIGPKDTFEEGEPEYTGGGTIDMVTPYFVRWAEPPEKEEAGSPNVIGVVALLASMRTLNNIKLENVKAYEESLTNYAIQNLSDNDDLILYGMKERHSDDLGIIPFNIKGIRHDVVDKVLSYEAAIAVRSGCFCAQPYVQKILCVSEEEIEKRVINPSYPKPGMVRISFGLYNTLEEIDVFISMLNKIIREKSNYKNRYPSE